MAWDWSQDQVTAASRIGEALRATKRAKKQGFNVQQVRVTVRQAMAAFSAKDFATATRLADQVIEICGGLGPLPYRGPIK